MNTIVMAIRRALSSGYYLSLYSRVRGMATSNEVPLPTVLGTVDKLVPGMATRSRALSAPRGPRRRSPARLGSPARARARPEPGPPSPSSPDTISVTPALSLTLYSPSADPTAVCSVPSSASASTLEPASTSANLALPVRWTDPSPTPRSSCRASSAERGIRNLSPETVGDVVETDDVEGDDRQGVLAALGLIHPARELLDGVDAQSVLVSGSVRGRCRAPRGGSRTLTDRDGDERSRTGPRRRARRVPRRTRSGATPRAPLRRSSDRSARATAAPPREGGP